MRTRLEELHTDTGIMGPERRSVTGIWDHIFPKKVGGGPPDLQAPRNFNVPAALNLR